MISLAGGLRSIAVASEKIAYLTATKYPSAVRFDSVKLNECMQMLLKYSFTYRKKRIW